MSNLTQIVEPISVEIPNRNRGWFLFAIIVTIALGLASRRLPCAISSPLGKYPGDALWALMAFFCWGAIFPKITTFRNAQCALVTSCAVEIFKLYKAPWIVTIRHSTLGHLVFGHAFSWQNIVAYTVGVLGGVIIEFAVHRLRVLRHGASQDLK